MADIPQPPTPSPQQIAEVMKRQQAEMARSQQIAQQRAAELANDPAFAHITENVNPRFQQQQQQQQPVQQQQQQQQVPSPIQGMTAEQVLAGPQRNMVAEVAQQQAPPPAKDVVKWYPTRGAKNTVSIELTDSILKNIPGNGSSGESDPYSKIMLALLGEILALKEMIMSGPANQELSTRVSQLENVLMEQRQGMSARARSVREQIAMFTEKGMSAEEMIKALESQSASAESLVQNSGSTEEEK